MSTQGFRRAVLSVAAVAGTLVCSWAAEVKISLPLGRNVYQTNEAIELAVVRRSDGELKATDLVLTAADEAGSKLQFTMPVAGGGTVRVEHVRLDARLLRPGQYTVTVAVDGSETSAPIGIHSHIRRSEYRLVNWGGSQANKGTAQFTAGEDSLGYNLLLAHYSPYGAGETIVAGSDYARCCTMSGGHQMDLRQECDWSDPYVTSGGRRRMSRQAMRDRTKSNAIAVHAYDEPGLTWWDYPAIFHYVREGETLDAIAKKYEKTVDEIRGRNRMKPEDKIAVGQCLSIPGKMTAHMIWKQVEAYRAAFGEDPLAFDQLDPKNPEHVARWRQWARWKLAFMDAAWQDAQFAVSYIDPSLQTYTQSQYGFSTFTDGYYFNVQRSLPITLGHGGYHDWGPGYYHPSLTVEIARARDYWKPCWYLPCWYSNTTSDQLRLEQYMSFQTNLQGLMTPPPCDPVEPWKTPAAGGIVESNKLMMRLGPVFNHLPVTKPPVAMLFSLSHNIHHQATRDINFFYSHGDAHGANLTQTYIAGKLLQQQFFVVVDEDLIDGSLAADHRAVILTSIDYLDPAVVTALEQFIANGGLVLKTSDSEVQIKGAVDLGVTAAIPESDLEKTKALREKLKATTDKEQQKAIGAEITALTGMRGNIRAAQTLAEAIKPQLEKAGIEPLIESSDREISATRQAAGDIEYLFALNARHDFNGNAQLGMLPTTSTIQLANDGRPVYDAIRGGIEAAFQVKGKKLSGTFRFGPGALRVFARTSRPIGKVRVAAPVVRREFVREDSPYTVTIAAALTDNQGGLLGGAAPLRLRIVDALGNTRYDLYRATEDGVLRLELPLAVNDAVGAWTVTVQDLLANTEDRASFTLSPIRTCSAAAGTVARAVSFPGDRQAVHRFFRLHPQVTIVKGQSAFNTAAAERLQQILKPWNVTCTIVDADTVNKPRTLTEEEAITWTGLDFGRASAGDKNSVGKAGFAINGHVILLGNPEDNPLIDFLQKAEFLPYQPDRNVFPGPGRGYLSWQFDGIGKGQESVALIAYDEAGMKEAVGSLFEAQACLDPLTRWEQPAASTVMPAARNTALPAATIVWQTLLDDHADAVKADASLTVVTHAGTICTLDPGGKITKTTACDNAEAALVKSGLQPAVIGDAERKQFALPARIVKYVAANDDTTAVGYWGGEVRMLDAKGSVLAVCHFDADVCGLGWLGKTLAVALSDGRVIGLTQK